MGMPVSGALPGVQCSSAGMVGGCQHCDEAHLHRNLAAFDFRYNCRMRLRSATWNAQKICFAWLATSALPIGGLVKPVTPKQKAAAFLRWQNAPQHLTKNAKCIFCFLTIPPTPLNNAHQGGFLLPEFNKPSLRVPEQVTLLRQRGLEIGNEASAAKHLKFIGYYRLSGYMLPFQRGGNDADRHTFAAGTTFQDILDLYTFDRKLRLLLLDAIERIEIAVRAALSTILASQYGSHWYLDAARFDRNFDHADFMERSKREIGHDDARRRQVFIQHYYNAYDRPPTPPSWMLFEALPFGNVSMAVKGLDIAERKRLAAPFNLPEPAIQSWPHVLSYVRNLCAHHSRLWNRKFTIRPFIIKQYRDDLRRNDQLYAQLVVTQLFMKRISPDSLWPDRLEALLGEYPAITAARLRFPDAWRERPVWR
jgi:abortive infection bacteriophage resistance protein